LQSFDELKGQIQQCELNVITKENRHKFVNELGSATITKKILDHKIRTLRPLVYFPEELRAILVYLPTEKEIIKGEGDKQHKEKEFVNSAFFAISDKGKRKILPFDDPQLADNYKITVIPEWNNTRWETADLKKWESEQTKTDPKILWDLIGTTTKKYLEFENEGEYIKFNLYNIGTYLYELFDSYPINDFTGTKAAGKSKSLTFQTLVGYNAFMSGNMSASALFRLREGTGGLICIDETEQFKNKNNDGAQETRTLLLQSFLKNQYAVRVEGKQTGGFNITPFNLYGPTSLAHINSFDDVLEDRCIPQINKRALNSKIKNSWPTEHDQDFQKIRNLCYRFFLDYADEVIKIQSEAREMLDVSGRELQLWTPIITLALFFERYCGLNIVETVKNTVTTSKADRQLFDEQESNDLKVLNFLSDVGVKIGQDENKRKENPPSWVPSKVLYDEILKCEDYGFSSEWFHVKGLTQILRRLGFRSEKKVAGISWEINQTKVDEIKKRWGLDSASASSANSASSASRLKNGHETEQTEGNEGNEPDNATLNQYQSRHKTEQTEQTELDQKNTSSASSVRTYTCRKCQNMSYKSSKGTIQDLEVNHRQQFGEDHIFEEVIEI
jgi:hypothetical protein